MMFQYLLCVTYKLSITPDSLSALPVVQISIPVNKLSITPDSLSALLVVRINIQVNKSVYISELL